MGTDLGLFQVKIKNLIYKILLNPIPSLENIAYIIIMHKIISLLDLMVTLCYNIKPILLLRQIPDLFVLISLSLNKT